MNNQQLNETLYYEMQQQHLASNAHVAAKRSANCADAGGRSSLRRSDYSACRINKLARHSAMGKLTFKHTPAKHTSAKHGWRQVVPFFTTLSF
jgi:hypothetical protein